jgi:hypothetical protein
MLRVFFWKLLVFYREHDRKREVIFNDDVLYMYVRSYATRKPCHRVDHPDTLPGRQPIAVEVKCVKQRLAQDQTLS